MSSRAKLTVVVIVVALLALLVNGWISSNKLSNENPIRIGAVISLSGDASPWGEYARDGMNLAAKTINANGGVNGRKVEITIEDDHTDPKQGVSAFNKLVTIDKVDGVIGGVFDFTAQPLIPLAKTNQIPFISASNFRIPGGFDLNEYSFVMLNDFSETIRELGIYIKPNTDIKKFAVVHYKSTFGEEIRKTLSQMMLSLGRNDVLDYPYASIGNNDWKTTIIKLKEAGVDTVFLDMVANDPLNFLKQSKQLGFNPKVITYNGALDSFANESDKSLLSGVILLNWEVVTQEFDNLFKKEYSRGAGKSADKYFDAVYVMAQTLANVKDKSKAPEYMISTTFSSPNGTTKFNANHVVEDVAVEIKSL